MLTAKAIFMGLALASPFIGMGTVFTVLALRGFTLGDMYPTRHTNPKPVAKKPAPAPEPRQSYDPENRSGMGGTIRGGAADQLRRSIARNAA